MSLGETCETFLSQVDELDLGDTAHAARLDHLVKKLARDAVDHVGDYRLGEVAALVQRCHDVLAALAVEAEDPEDRQRRYSRQAALLNLLVLCQAVRAFHTGSRAEQRKAANVNALRDLIADALDGLVEGAEDRS